MADELDPVTQKFIADMTEYVADIQRGVDDAMEFAAANDEAAASLSKVRDDAAAAAAALAAYNEEAGQAGSAQSNFSADAEKAASDLTKLHDETVSAGDAQKQAGQDTDTWRSKLDALGSDLQTRTAGIRDAGLAVTGVGDAMTAASSESSMFARVMAGAGLATGLLEPVVAGVAVAAGGLASGAVAAGAGLGVFALVAKSAYSEVSTAVKAYGTATSTTGKASATAMAQYKADLAALTPAQRAFAEGITGAQNAWQNFVAANTSGVTKIMEQGLGLLPKILAAIQPLLAPVETALSGMITQLGHGLDSSGFKSFMDALTANTGPAITKLATAIGNVIRGIGGILSAFMPVSQGILSGLDSITAKFAEWGSTLSSHSGFESLMETFKSETPQAIAILKNLAVVVKNVVAGMAGLATGANSKTLLAVLEPLSGILAKLSQNQDLVRIALYFLAAADAGKKLSSTVQGIQGAFSVFKTGASALTDLKAGFTNSAAAASDATGIFGTIGGKISTIGSALATAGSAVASFVAGMAKQLVQAAIDTGVWIAEHAVAAAAFIAENVAMAVSATAAFIAENAATLGIIAGIALLVAGIVLLATHWSEVWGLVKSVALDAWNFLNSSVIQPIESGISAMVTAVTGFFTKMFSDVTSAVSTGVNAIVSFFTTLWTDVTNAVSTGITNVVNFFTALPGKIISALAALPGDLLAIGENIMTGLWNGLKAIGASILSWVEGFASDVSSAFSKVLSILSPSRVFYQHGVNTMQGYIDGVKSMSGAVRSTMAQAGGQVAAGGIGGAGGGSSSSSHTVNVTARFGAGTEGLNDPRFLQYLQQQMQEAVLRYTQVNPSNGLTLNGKLT